MITVKGLTVKLWLYTVELIIEIHFEKASNK